MKSQEPARIPKDQLIDELKQLQLMLKRRRNNWDLAMRAGALVFDLRYQHGVSNSEMLRILSENRSGSLPLQMKRPQGTLSVSEIVA